ncbi:MAG TPA: hypothetical protein VIL46_08235 [Gemmataceae bacterium]
MSRRSGRQVDVIAAGLGLTGPARNRKGALLRDGARLGPYLFVQEVAKFKSKHAVVDCAKDLLPKEVFDACRKQGDDFDTLALCFALYNRDYRDLTLVLHLDKVQKTGFARMELDQNLRRPRQPLEEFLAADRVETLLGDCDGEAGDGRVSELRGLVLREGHHMVFVRRPERPERVLRERAVVHGYRPEWIVLDFFDGAKRVNIASVSVGVPLAIANRIASAYFGAACEYVNERRSVAPKQLTEFLRSLCGERDGLILVEAVVANSPLAGSPTVKISDPDSRPIGPAIAQFEAVVGRLLSDPERVESIRVVYRKKRVSVIFEKDSAGEFEVRYADAHLSASERRLFETHLREAYGIPVLSTEKRFKRRP